MNVIRILYIIATIVKVAKSSVEADDGSMLAQRLFESKHLLRGSGLNDEKETRNKDETSVNQRPKSMLEAGTKRLLQLVEINLDCDDDKINSDDNDDVESNDENPLTMYPSPTPSIATYEEKKLVTSDGKPSDYFGISCSISDELVVISAPWVGDYNTGAAYLFHLDGTEVMKLTPGDDGEEDDRFGGSVSMDEKVVVGSYGGYLKVFSRDGTYERTLTCDDCILFGDDVATLGNLIVTEGSIHETSRYDDQNSTSKLFIYSTEDGQLLKSLEQGSDRIFEIAISEQLIVSTTEHTTFIYSNTFPDFPKIAEINRGGAKVAVSSGRIVISYALANGYDGEAYLYKTDGTLVSTLDRQDASNGSWFGWSVAIADEKVIVSAPYDDESQNDSGSIFIYSAVTGEFIKKVLAPDGEAYDCFGVGVCASDSYYVVGAPYADVVDYGAGAAYLFHLP